MWNIFLFIYICVRASLPGDFCQLLGLTPACLGPSGTAHCASNPLSHTRCCLGLLSSVRTKKMVILVAFKPDTLFICLRLYPTWTSWRSKTLFILSSIKEYVPYLAQCPGESDLWRSRTGFLLGKWEKKKEQTFYASANTVLPGFLWQQ